MEDVINYLSNLNLNNNNHHQNKTKTKQLTTFNMQV
jgi:hypothetical protein